MKVILFGATGMVGQGVLRECLLDSEVETVLAIGRSPTGQRHAKLQEIVHSDFSDFSDFSGIADRVSGYDACFFCLGVSSAGMGEADYRRVTFDITLAAAKALVDRNPAMTFVYVSGAGTDSTERGRTMWARVKGKTENALLALPFRAAYMFRPAVIQPGPGIVSKTKSYRVLYGVFGPLFPLLRTLFPRFVTTTEEVGRAMIEVATHGAGQRVLENADIIALGR
ncbi:MAG: NAD(P)H-binding protein [Acidobacteriota bacterium]